MNIIAFPNIFLYKITYYFVIKYKLPLDESPFLRYTEPIKIKI